MKVTYDNLPQTVSEISEQITEIKKLITDKPQHVSEEYLTREKLANMFDVDVATISVWVKKKKLKAYGIGNRVYFKRSEIETAIKPIN